MKTFAFFLYNILLTFEHFEISKNSCGLINLIEFLPNKMFTKQMFFWDVIYLKVSVTVNYKLIVLYCTMYHT